MSHAINWFEIPVTDLDRAIDFYAVAAGGSVLVGKTALPPGMGSFAQIVDTEGNRIGLHALA